MNKADLPYVVFFDGECGFCHRFVQFIFAFDRKDRLKVAPLQGSYAARHLPTAEIRDVRTVVLWTAKGSIYTKSEACFRILCIMGGFWKLLGSIGLAVPKFLRDPIYLFIAKHRYKIFGHKDVCPLPTQKYLHKFLS